MRIFCLIIPVLLVLSASLLAQTRLVQVAPASAVPALKTYRQSRIDDPGAGLTLTVLYGLRAQGDLIVSVDEGRSWLPFLQTPAATADLLCVGWNSVGLYDLQNETLYVASYPRFHWRSYAVPRPPGSFDQIFAIGYLFDARGSLVDLEVRLRAQPSGELRRMLWWPRQAGGWIVGSTYPGSRLVDCGSDVTDEFGRSGVQTRPTEAPVIGVGAMTLEVRNGGTNRRHRIAVTSLGFTDTFRRLQPLGMPEFDRAYSFGFGPHDGFAWALYRGQQALGLFQIVRSDGVFGQGCNNTRIIPSVPGPGISQVLLPAGAQLGVAMVGINRRHYLGLDLPADLRSLGAPGCELLTSMEVSIPLAINGQVGTLTQPLPTPPFAVQSIFVQAAVFAPMNRLGVSFSDGYERAY